MVAALLLAVLAFGLGAGGAAAHGGHAHGVSAISVTSEISAQDREPVVEVRASSVRSVAASIDVAHKSSGTSSKSDCCCGGVMCHAGMTFAYETLTVPFQAGARVVAVPASGHPQSNGSGLERPPRSI
jgi:hypothetical protein